MSFILSIFTWLFLFNIPANTCTLYPPRINISFYMKWQPNKYLVSHLKEKIAEIYLAFLQVKNCAALVPQSSYHFSKQHSDVKAKHFLEFFFMRHKSYYYYDICKIIKIKCAVFCNSFPQPHPNQNKYLYSFALWYLWRGLHADEYSEGR